MFSCRPAGSSSHRRVHGGRQSDQRATGETALRVQSRQSTDAALVVQKQPADSKRIQVRQFLDRDAVALLRHPRILVIVVSLSAAQLCRAISIFSVQNLKKTVTRPIRTRDVTAVLSES